MKLLLKSCLLFILFASVSTKAQQIAGGEITYACNGNDNYKVTLILYAKCPNPELPATVTMGVFSSNTNTNVPPATLIPTGADEIIRACLGKPSTCEGGTGETADALTKRIYTTTIKLPSKLADWLLVVQEGPRTTMSNVKDKNLMNLTALINNKAACNSSPTFNNNPLSFSSSNLSVVYDPGLKDPESDKLAVKLVSPKASIQQDLQFASSSFTPTHPFSSSGPISVDASNGKLSFTPTTSGESSTVAMQVTETRNGVVIGNVTREMYFQTMPQLNAPPVLSGPDTVKICAGEAVSINYEGTSSDASAQLDILINNKQAEWQSFNSSVAKSPGKAILTLSSFSSLPVNTVKPLNISLVDDKCGIVTRTVYVKVYPKPSISNLSSDTTVLCLNAFKINVNATGGTKPYTYAVNNNAVSTPVLTIDAAGTFLFTVKDLNGCTASFQKRVISPINFQKADVACVDSLITFYDVSAGTPFPLKSNPQSKTTTWKWSFGDGSPTDAAITPKHKFPDLDVAKTYSVTMEVSDGKDCKNTITKSVKIYPKPKVSFSPVERCVKTERSDLKVEDAITSDTTILPANINYYVDFNPIPRTNTFQNRHPTLLSETKEGKHDIRVEVKDNAGCVQTLSQTVVVNPKPKIIQSPTPDAYYYKCNTTNFPDTSFAYKAIVKDTALPLQVEVLRSNMTKITIPSASNISVPVAYTVVPNKINEITFKTQDALGCTNDTVTRILDPVNPRIALEKYYCFDGDNLKLVDSTFILNNYKWGLKSAVWDLKDGSTDNTIGHTDHKYTLEALDEAKVILGVTDNTGCTDSTTFQVYLSEPDTSQFQITKPLACFNEDVKIVSIKNPYINTWYFKYKDTSNFVYRKFDSEIFNNSFGKSVPVNLDHTERPASNKYVASTTIFYNEANSGKNFVKDPRFPNSIILPKVIAKPEVCHVTVTRNWRVVEQLRYTIDDVYNRCYGFDKSFHATLKDTASHEMKLVDNSWLWTLKSPQGKIIDSLRLAVNTNLNYRADSLLFTDIVSPRSIPSTNPYVLKIKFQNTNKLITCTDSAVLNIINEKVSFTMDTAVQTCSFYTNTFQYSKPLFLTSNDLNKTIWNFGDSTKLDTVRFQPHQFVKKGSYVVKASVANEYGCTYQDSTKVTVKPSPKASLSVLPVCLGLESILNGKSISADTNNVNSKIVNYYWYYSLTVPTDTDPNKPDITKSVKHTLVNEDTLIDKFPVGNNPVSLAVEDANGCFSFSPSPIFARVTPLPESDFTALAKSTQDQDYLGFEPIEFRSITQNTKYWKWNFGDGNIKESLPSDSGDVALDYTYPYYAPPYPKEKNIYDVTLFVRTTAGCVDSVKKQIDVNAYFEMPNAFSPNEDGLHDNLLGIGKGIKEIKEFKIFNRWGEVIHSVTGTPEKDALKRGYLLWDGVYNGQIQPVGAYVYYAVVKTGYGNDLIKKGNLTLLK